MRITGGTLVGRTFAPPLSTETRPMMDRVRQALFNILSHRDWGKYIGDVFDEETHVLDAFCGTGALAFESISYGAAHATLFDLSPDALKIARQNAASLGVTHQCSIIAADATRPPAAPKACKLVFLAPPYRKNLILPSLHALDAAGWIAPHAVIVAETAKTETLATPEGFDPVLSRSYGEPLLHFLKR
ncbi:MAG: RsmD family RNA methyltransferase [Alphaproteobacteria bacterium]|nr:RsmD family RNA methyltransferase [Alphaproteobacteria bacterium]